MNLDFFTAVVEKQNTNFSTLPVSLLAADNHNIGNNGISWFSPASWYEAATNLPSFAAVSMLSGANSFYNTGVAIANIFGADVEARKTSTWITDLDSNLGAYYDKNRESADLVGFIAGAFAPGIAGLRILSAGQKALTAAKNSGYIGGNLGRALGLLNPSASYYTQQSIKQIVTAQTTFSSINANTLRALAAGAGEAVVQSAAFEIAVVATTFKSPILEDMDLGNLVRNIAIGAVLGGTVGGIFTGAKTFGTIKKAVGSIDEIEKAYTFVPQMYEGATPSDRIVLWLNALRDAPAPEVGAKLAASVLKQDSAVKDFTTRFTQQAKSRDTAVWNAVRTELRKISEDEFVVESLYNTIRGMDSDQVVKTLLAAEEINRANVPLKLSKEMHKAQKTQASELVGILDKFNKQVVEFIETAKKTPAAFEKEVDFFTSKAVKTASFKGVKKDLDNFIRRYTGPEKEEWSNIVNSIKTAIDAKNFPVARSMFDDLIFSRTETLDLHTYSTGWIKLWGDDAGTVVAERPSTLSLSDTQKNVAEFVEKQNFSIDKSIGLFELLNNPERIQARQIWAHTLREDQFPTVVDATDFPLLERAFLLQKEIKVRSDEGLVLLSGDRLFQFIQQHKDEAAIAMLEPRIAISTKLAGAQTKAETAELVKQLNKTYNSDDIARLLNVRRSYLEDVISDDPVADLFAYQHLQRKYQENLVAKGLWNNLQGQYELYKLPQWLQIGYKRAVVPDVDEGHVLAEIAYLKGKEKLHMQAVEQMLALPHQMGIYAPQFFDLPEEAILQSTRFGAGAGLFSFANGMYGTLASMVESIGASTGLLKIAKRQQLREILEPKLLALRGNTEAALEVQAVFQRLASIRENYVLVSGGHLRAQQLVEYDEAIAAGKKIVIVPVLQEGAPEEIFIKNLDAQDFIEAHVHTNGVRLLGRKERAALRGQEMSLRHDVVYVPKPDTRDYPHFFFVVDDHVTSEASGRVRMVHAATAKDLEMLRSKVPTDNNYRVVLKGETEEYYKARGMYDFEQSLHNSNIDNALQRRGVNSQFLPKTDPKLITDDLLNWHLRQEDIAVRDMVSIRYSKEFTELEKLGEQYTGISLSRYGYDRKFAENVVKNPYVNYIKTALDISKIEEYPLLATINRTVDRAVSEAVHAIGSIFNATKGPEDLKQVNDAMARYGLKTVFADVDTLIAANHTAPRGALTSFVQDANALLATTILRLDPLNAINNALGSNVMLGTEIKAVLRAIRGDNVSVGKLRGLMQVGIPGTQPLVNVLTPGKLIANALRDYTEALTKPEILDEYRRLGYITDITTQFYRMLDDLTLKGTESVTDLNSRISRVYAHAREIGNKGEKWTGNTHAEELNRFLSANVMKQITDVAVAAGRLSKQEAVSYIRTFVNRAQGNIIASQRPMIFQGPIGQAIGLFQTYQFNLIQQLLRHIGEGSAKDAAVLLGLQGTIYGLNGLPAFSFINQHIVGTASGNKEHRDFYTATYGLLGNNVADVLMYGLPSNLLGVNLFTRGDINPRHPTVLPIHPLDVPFVSAFGKFLNNTREAFSKTVAGGQVWESFLQGVEHNGLSRPLSGLAQVLRGVEDGNVFSTSTRGTILGANDFWSLASVTRLIGGKPFDEARLVDSMHRFLYYTTYDRRRMRSLGEAFKTISVDGAMPSPEQIENFAAKYAERGGNIRNFNQWMMEQIKNSQTSGVNRIAENLNRPYAQQMQLLMGGEPFVDSRIFER